MVSEPFLILHKVRGEPAFDIAERNDDMGTPSDPGPWWIIPTSGHRAYPFWHVPVNCLALPPTFPETREIDSRLFNTPMPDPWPDHYQASQARSRLATAASDILSLMGIRKAPPQEPIKRRVIPNG